jgi:hypothetical protein
VEHWWARDERAGAVSTLHEFSVSGPHPNVFARQAAGGPIGEIEQDMKKIHKELSPCDVVMADIQATTPDSRVNELLQICRRLEGKGT